MAGRQRGFHYYQQRQKQVEREGDIKTNLVFGMADKTNSTYLEDKYKSVEDKYGIEFAQPVERRAAPTTNAARPRALNLAYMKDTETLLVQFRDKTICEYSNIPIEIWQDLKVTDSTGKYMKDSGLDSAGYRKVGKNQFPQEISVLFD